MQFSSRCYSFTFDTVFTNPGQVTYLACQFFLYPTNIINEKVCEDWSNIYNLVTVAFYYTSLK